MCFLLQLVTPVGGSKSLVPLFYDVQTNIVGIGSYLDLSDHDCLTIETLGYWGEHGQLEPMAGGNNWK